jgi:salicylate hydroxylase
MTENTTQKALRVAIVGAGIAGLTTAKALRHFYPKEAVDIKIYDKATKLSEVGASIGVHTSGLRILDRLGVHAALDESICIRQSSGSPIAFRHWSTDEVLGMQDSKGEVEGGGVEEKYRPARFHRAHLQQVLIEALPGDVELRLATKLSATSVNPGSANPVTLSFEDGSSAAADLLIAGDGVYSKIRSTYVPEAEVKWLGMIAFRAAFDAALVKDIEGLPTDAVRWSGPDDRNFVSGRLGTSPSTLVASICPVHDHFC